MWANRSAIWLQLTRHSDSVYCTQSHLVSYVCSPQSSSRWGGSRRIVETLRASVREQCFVLLFCFILLRLPSMSRPKGLYWSNLPCPCSPVLEGRRDHVRPAGFVDVRIGTERESVRICPSWYLSSWNLHTSGGPCFDWVDFFLFSIFSFNSFFFAKGVTIFSLLASNRNAIWVNERAPSQFVASTITWRQK